jgi:hypothetical protein
LRHSLTTAAVALFGAAAMAGLATPASAATSATVRPAGVYYVLWGYFADTPTCYHQGAILAASHPTWLGYYCQVDPTRPATNVGLWYELAD